MSVKPEFEAIQPYNFTFVESKNVSHIPEQNDSRADSLHKQDYNRKEFIKVPEGAIEHY